MLTFIFAFVSFQAILLREIGDIYLAVEYVQEYDVLLWEELIDYSMAHHTYLVRPSCTLHFRLLNSLPSQAQLLDVVGLYTDFSPQMLIWKVGGYQYSYEENKCTKHLIFAATPVHGDTVSTATVNRLAAAL